MFFLYRSAVWRWAGFFTVIPGCSSLCIMFCDVGINAELQLGSSSTSLFVSDVNKIIADPESLWLNHKKWTDKDKAIFLEICNDR
jgi:hypothetical protein